MGEIMERAKDRFRLRDNMYLFGQYSVLGKSLQKIGDEHGCSATTVGYWLRKHGIETRRSGPSVGSDDPIYRNKGVMYDLYVHKGLSIRDIATKMHCKSPTILYWLRKHGIETRTQKEAWAAKIASRMANGDDLMKLHHIGGYTLTELGRIFGVSREAVSQWFKNGGIAVVRPGKTAMKVGENELVGMTVDQACKFVSDRMRFVLEIENGKGLEDRVD
jgi:transposase-like protein